VTLHVLPAWWQTLWFRALISLAALVVLVLVVRHVSHRRLRQTLLRLERETALERERTRIAHNIHDELGAGLTRISLLTQSGHDRAKSQLDRIYDIVGDLIQSMDEIVWAVNPGNDDLENVASYLSEYAQSYLSDAGLRCRVQIPHGLPDHVLTAQFRHHLFLTCKEALHNVVKHARATDVSVQIEARDETLIVSITDNGVGLPADLGETSHRNGLKTMRSRMQSLGGTLEIAAAADRGTVVTLVVTLPPRGAVP
jgi:signal transduction histidine kinase